jgi:hypothetical protein
MVTPVRTVGRSLRAAGLDADVRQLAEDDALLLRGVQRRAASVVALAAARTWPYAELDTLTSFLRAAVLPHATNEEDRSYPDGVAAPFAQLCAEHAHLDALTEQLEHVNAASCTLPELRRMIDDLEHHMIKKHSALAAQLAALDDMPCVPDPDPGPPEQPLLILIDALREDHTVQMRVQRLHPGQPAAIRASRDNGLQALHQRVDSDREEVRACDRSARRRQAPAIASDDRRPDLVGRTRL